MFEKLDDIREVLLNLKDDAMKKNDLTENMDKLAKFTEELGEYIKQRGGNRARGKNTKATQITK